MSTSGGPSPPAPHGWIAPAFGAPARVGSLMTTREGGVSEGLASSLDLGPARLDRLDPAAHAAVVENRRRVRARLPSDPVWLEQVHGREVVDVNAANAAALRDTPPTADAAVTREPHVVLAVRVADCLPVLLADRDGSVVAAAHAGWRGLAAGVLEATVEAMRVPGDRLVAWIGPSIGPRAFEVGRDVLEAFCSVDLALTRHFAPRRPGKWLADLPALARLRLGAVGVHDLVVDGACTFEDAARFFSFRRDGTSGRMAAFVWLA